MDHHAGDDTTLILQLRPSQPLRVLVVDDDPFICEHLSALVTSAGFETQSVTTGRDALAALHARFAPIVIADRNMPDMDGLALCRTIRSDSYDGYVYILLLTSKDSEADILAGLEAGADDYLSKRVSSAQLIARLRTAQRILGLEFSLRAAIEEKSRLATTDVLTGANNRRYFVKHLKRELARVQRYGGDLSVLVLDIDHFKRVNDHHGHGVGDEVLKKFARCVAHCLPRQNDWYARLGGEEFVVVLPDTALSGAEIVAEKIRRHVEQTRIDTSAGALHITVSVGGSSLQSLPTRAQDLFDQLLESADRCLYRSKDDGRNRVTLSALPTAYPTLRSRP